MIRRLFASNNIFCNSYLYVNLYFLSFQSVLREGYLKEMIQVLSDPRYGSNLSQVDATVKKHEAISADILARVSRATITAVP